jgi:hypothetical protein
MYARFRALVCLLFVGALAARAEEHSHGGGTVLVYLRQPEGISVGIVDEMQRETGVLMQSAGIRVQWSRPPERPDIESGLLIVVNFAGACTSDPELLSGMEVSSRILAFTPLDRGNVLPFSTVDCTALGKFLSPALTQEPKVYRDYLYGRSMGRILAHELYHVIAQTSGHSHAGVGEAAVTLRELTSDDFFFGKDALARMQGPVALSGNPAAGANAPAAGQ